MMYFFLHSEDTEVSLGMTQDKAGCLGDNNSIRIAHTRRAEVKMFRLEGNVGELGEVFRINHHRVIGVTALIECLGEKDIESAELGVYLAEVNAPFGHIVARSEGALRALEGMQLGDETRAADEQPAVGA